MRGERLLMVRTALSLPHCINSCSNHRFRLSGLAGGKTPARREIDSQHIQMSNERLLRMLEFVAARALVQQPAHRVMRHTQP